MRLFKNLFRKEREKEPPVPDMVEVPEDYVCKFEKTLLIMAERDEWTIENSGRSIYGVMVYKHESGVSLVHLGVWRVSKPIHFGLTDETAKKIGQIFHAKEKAVKDKQAQQDAQFLCEFIEGAWPHSFETTTKLDIDQDLQEKVRCFKTLNGYQYHFREAEHAVFYRLLSN